MELGLVDIGDDGEHNGVCFAEISSPLLCEQKPTRVWVVSMTFMKDGVSAMVFIVHLACTAVSSSSQLNNR